MQKTKESLFKVNTSHINEHQLKLVFIYVTYGQLSVEFRDRSGEALKLLLERGFDPNVQHSSNSSTPLHLAVKRDNEMAVRILTQCPECNINLQVCLT